MKTCVQCGEEMNEYEITKVLYIQENITTSEVNGTLFYCNNKQCKNYALLATPKEDIPNKEV